MAATYPAMLSVVSLHPIPPANEVRTAVQHLLDRNPSPADMLRTMADVVEAGLVPGRPLAPVHEGPWLPDYWHHVHRRSVRVTPEMKTRLELLAFATGLTLCSLVRLALAGR